MFTQSNSKGAGRQEAATAKLIVVAPKWQLPCEKVGLTVKTSLSWRQVLRKLDLKATPNGVKFVSVHGYHPSFVLKTGPERRFALHETVGDLISALENSSTVKVQLSKKTKYTVRICLKTRSRGKENRVMLARAAAAAIAGPSSDSAEKLQLSDSIAQLAMEADCISKDVRECSLNVLSFT